MSAPTDAEGRFAHLVLIGALACVVLAYTGFFLLGDMHVILGGVPDDYFYYLRVAENVATGKGWTFDQLGLTNGFQPLWMGMLVPLHLVAPDRPEGVARAGLVLSTTMCAAAVLFVYNSFTRLLGKRDGAIVGLAAMVLVFRSATTGMEGAAVVLAQSALFFWGLRIKVWESTSAGRLLAFGVILGTCVLARLDVVFLGAAVGAIFLVRAARGDRADKVRCAVIGGGAAIPIVPYLAHNLVVFGRLMPISGQLKSTFPHPDFAGVPTKLRWILHVGVEGPASAILGVIALFWLGRRLARGGETSPEIRYLQGATLALSAAAALHFTQESLCLRWAVLPGHFAIGWLLPAMITGCVLQAGLVPGEQKRLIVGAFAVISLIAVGRNLRGRAGQAADNMWRAYVYDTALWVRDNTPKDTIVGMKDCGVLGYFSRRRVVNLDGVVNNLEFQEALRDKALGAYLRAKGVNLLVQHTFLPEDVDFYWRADGGKGDVVKGEYETVTFRYPSHMFLNFSDDIVVRRDAEVFRGKPFEDFGIPERVVVWKL